jgi:hypothetical protein
LVWLASAIAIPWVYGWMSRKRRARQETEALEKAEAEAAEDRGEA